MQTDMQIVSNKKAPLATGHARHINVKREAFSLENQTARTAKRRCRLAATPVADASGVFPAG